MQLTNQITDHNTFFQTFLYSSDPISKIVIIILITLSVISWTIIIQKLYYIYSINRKMTLFKKQFNESKKFSNLYENTKHLINDPLKLIFIDTINQYRLFLIDSKDDTNYNNIDILKNNLFQTSNIIKDQEIENIEKNLNFLASIGSNALLIGLFGTVCGIMNSFQSITMSNNNSLSIIAPGISEALLATAIGLIVAIPATFFYNFISSKIVEIDNLINTFIIELNIKLFNYIK